MQNHFNAALGTVKALVRTNDPHIIPHQTPDLIPVMGHHDGFIRIQGVGLIPRGQLNLGFFAASSNSFNEAWEALWA